MCEDGCPSQRKCTIVQYNHISQGGGGDEISFTKMGRVYKLVVQKYALFTLVCGNIFVHYW